MTGMYDEEEKYDYWSKDKKLEVKNMTAFVTNETEDEEVLFAAFGAVKKGKDPKKSLLIKEGKSLTGVVTQINEGGQFKLTCRLKVEGQKKPIIVLGMTDLIAKMGYGPKKAPRQVKVDDLIQITFKGVKPTAKGRPFHQFEVGIAN